MLFKNRNSGQGCAPFSFRNENNKSFKLYIRNRHNSAMPMKLNVSKSEHTGN